MLELIHKSRHGLRVKWFSTRRRQIVDNCENKSGCETNVRSRKLPNKSEDCLCAGSFIKVLSRVK